MEIQEVVTYLAAAAASDEPIDGRERDLMTHLLRDFGADLQTAQALVKQIPADFTGQATLNSLQDRDTALKLLRALLVISYCDGCFEQEEFVYLTPIVDKFQVNGPELNRLKMQAFYFLRQDPPSIKIPDELIKAENWDAVCEFAHTQYDLFRREFHKRFQDEIDRADEETCYLAMSVGPPTFDTEHTKSRFLQSNPDFLHLEDQQAMQILRDEAEQKLRGRWEAAYAGRCNFCYLEAPGKLRDCCPRCQGEYGVSAR